MDQVIKLGDGIEVEVAVIDGELVEISNGSQMDSSIEQVNSLLNQVITPVTNAFDSMKNNVEVESAKIVVGVKFGASGNVFIAKGTAEANITVEMMIRPTHA